MIAKFILNSTQDPRIIFCECDLIKVLIKEHPYGCGCEACSTLSNEETRKHKCGISVKTIECDKLDKEPTCFPDGTIEYGSKSVMYQCLGKRDICYALNDEGKTIDKENG